MKYFLSCLLALTILTSSQAQCGPRVQEVVTAVGDKFDASKAYSVDFIIGMNYVGEPATEQKGRITVQGNRFFLKMKDQQFVSDGQTLWIYMPEEKEVQILNVADQAEWSNLSPISLLQQYCSNDFMSRSLGLTMEDSKEVEHLEFTPVDKDQDVFKVRISYDQNSKEVSRIKTFNKDGSRITIDANKYQYDITTTASVFTLDTEKLEGVHIEDLR